MSLEILDWNEDTAPIALRLLRRFEDTSLFLLGNLDMFGPSALENAPYSGDYKCIALDGHVIGVFCLNLIGTLLVQSDRSEDLTTDILDFVGAENVKGLLGDWTLVQPLWDEIKKRVPTTEPKFESNEILYRFELEHWDDYGQPVEQLSPTCFDEWEELSQAFGTELGLKPAGTPEQRKIQFERRAQEGCWWGLRVDGRLASMAGLNAKTEGVGQVGGVYTVPDQRRKGLSRRVMKGMMRSCKLEHAFHKLILFTGSTDSPARALYEGLGFEPVGRFGIIFVK